MVQHNDECCGFIGVRMNWPATWQREKREIPWQKKPVAAGRSGTIRGNCWVLVWCFLHFLSLFSLMCFAFVSAWKKSMAHPGTGTQMEVLVISGYHIWSQNPIETCLKISIEGLLRPHKLLGISVLSFLRFPLELFIASDSENLLDHR